VIIGSRLEKSGSLGMDVVSVIRSRVRVVRVAGEG
jgi:hypothetical protein